MKSPSKHESKAKRELTDRFIDENKRDVFDFWWQLPSWPLLMETLEIDIEEAAD